MMSFKRLFWNSLAACVILTLLLLSIGLVSAAVMDSTQALACFDFVNGTDMNKDYLGKYNISVNTCTNTSTGKLGQGLQIGSSCWAVTQLPGSVATSNLTIGAWIYHDALAGTYSWVDSFSATPNDAQLRLLSSNSAYAVANTWMLDAYLTTGRNIVTTGANSAQTGLYQLIIEKRQTSGTNASKNATGMTLTVQDANEVEDLKSVTNPYIIGAYNNTGAAGSPASGKIDVLFFTRETPTAAQEAAIYNSGVGLTCSEIFGSTTVEPSITFNSPGNGSANYIYASPQVSISATLNNLGAVLTAFQTWLYNNTGSLLNSYYLQLPTNNYTINLTSLPVGNYFINSTARNFTNVTIPDTSNYTFVNVSAMKDYNGTRRNNQTGTDFFRYTSDTNSNYINLTLGDIWFNTSVGTFAFGIWYNDRSTYTNKNWGLIGSAFDQVLGVLSTGVLFGIRNSTSGITSSSYSAIYNSTVFGLGCFNGTHTLIFRDGVLQDSDLFVSVEGQNVLGNLFAIVPSGSISGNGNSSVLNISIYKAVVFNNSQFSCQDIATNEYALGAYRVTNISDGLVLQYLLNQSGSAPFGNSSHVFNVNGTTTTTPNGNNLTTVGMPVINSTCGYSGNGVCLNGSQYGVSSSFDPGGDFHISLRMRKRTAAGSTMQILTKRSSATQRFQITIASSVLFFTTSDATSSNDLRYNLSSSNLEWVLLNVSCSGTNKSMWLDNNLVNSTTVTSCAGSFNSTQYWLLGAFNNSGIGGFYDGDVDDVRVKNTSGVTALWDFDSPSYAFSVLGGVLNFTIYNITNGSITTPANGSSISAQYYNVTWTNISLLPTGVGVRGTNFTLSFLNSTRGLIREVNKTNLLYYYWNVYNENQSTGTYYLRVTAWDNQSNSVNYTDHAIHIYNPTVNYTTPAIENQQYLFIINLTTNTLNVTVTTFNSSLYYNNTQYNATATINNGYLQAMFNITTPEVVSTVVKSFYFNYTINGVEYSTLNYNQTILFLTPINITSASCSPLDTAMFFDMKDEQNLTRMNGTIEYVFYFGVTNSTSKNVSGTLTNVANMSVCINSTISPNWTVGTGQIFYTSSGYVSRRYYIFSNTRVSTPPVNITLYNLAETPQTTFDLTVESNSLNTYNNKYTSLIRWYPATQSYPVVDMGLTDNSGRTVIHVVEEDVDYRIGVYELNGSLIYLAPAIRLTCLTTPACVYTLTIPDTATDYTSFLNIESDLTYNSTTGVWLYTFNDPSQRTSTMNLTVFKMTGTGQVNVCNSYVNAYTGAISCNTSIYTGTLKGVVQRSASPEVPIAQLIISTGINAFKNTFILWLFFIIMVPIVLIFAIISPILGVIGAAIALIPAWYLGAIGAPVVLGVVVLAGIVIHFMRRT